MKESKPFASYTDYSFYGILGLTVFVLAVLAVLSEALFGLLTGQHSFFRALFASVTSSVVDSAGQFLGLGSLIEKGQAGNGQLADFVSPGNRISLEKFLMNLLPISAVALLFAAFWSFVTSIAFLVLRPIQEALNFRTNEGYLAVIKYFFGIKRHKHKFVYPLYGKWMRTLCIVGMLSMAAEGAWVLANGWGPLFKLLGGDIDWLTTLLQGQTTVFPDFRVVDFFWIPLGTTFWFLSRAFPKTPKEELIENKDLTTEVVPDMALISRYLKERFASGQIPYKLNLKEVSQPWNLRRQFSATSQKLYQEAGNPWIVGATRKKDLLSVMGIREFRQEQISIIEAIEKRRNLVIRGAIGSGMRTTCLFSALSGVLDGKKALFLLHDKAAAADLRERFASVFDNLEWLKRTVVLRDLSEYGKFQAKFEIPDILYFDVSKKLVLPEEDGSENYYSFGDLARDLSIAYVGDLDSMTSQGLATARQVLDKLDHLAILRGAEGALRVSQVRFGSLESSLSLAKQVTAGLGPRDCFSLQPPQPLHTSIVLMSPSAPAETPESAGYRPDAIEEVARSEAPPFVMATVQNFGAGPVFWDGGRYWSASSFFPSLSRLYSLDYIQSRELTHDWLIDGGDSKRRSGFSRRQSSVGMGDIPTLLHRLDLAAGADADNERILWFVVDDTIVSRAVLDVLLKNLELVDMLKQAATRAPEAELPTGGFPPHLRVARAWVPEANGAEAITLAPVISCLSGDHVGRQPLPGYQVPLVSSAPEMAERRFKFKAPLDVAAGSNLNFVVEHAFHLFCQFAWRQYDHEVVASVVLEGASLTALRLVPACDARPELALAVMEFFKAQLNHDDPVSPVRRFFTSLAAELSTPPQEGAWLPILPHWRTEDPAALDAGNLAGLASVLKAFVDAVPLESEVGEE